MAANYRFYINNKEVNPPLEWRDIEIVASFDNDSVQANITTDSFVFVNEARQELLSWIDAGIDSGVGIFEGCPLRIEAFSTDKTITIFDGFVDLTSVVDSPESGRLEAGIFKADGLNSLSDKLSAITFGYLYESGVITESDFIDVDYVVVKPVSVIELAALSITIYLMSKELNEQIRRVAEDISTASGILAAGVTGTAGAAIYAIASAAFNVVYAVAILSAIAKLALEVINYLISLPRQHKGIKLFTLLRKAIESAGYTLSTDIADFDNIVYLPSNQNIDKQTLSSIIPASIEIGIPNSSDYGYKADEIAELCKRLFNGKFAVSDSLVQFRSENSELWQLESSYSLPDVLLNSYSYNTDELFANRLITFETDIADTWTIDNYTGTAYEIITDAVVASNQKAKALKGLDEIRLNVCLGSRKESLSILEEVLLGYASIVDEITGTMAKVAQVGGVNVSGTSFSSQIKGLVNALKVSDNNHSKPKLLWFEGDSIPENHRDLLSAKALYDKYWSYKSFVLDNGSYQKKQYNDVRIPFGLDNFIELVNNSYIATSESDKAKAVAIRWRLAADYANVDFWIKQQYTSNLTETYIEP